MTPATPTTIRRVSAAFGLVLLLSGCSSFQRDWNAAGKAHFPSPVAGRWEGHWHSDYNAHHGRLRCLLTAGTNGTYFARFRANYLRLLSFEYTVPLAMQATGTNSWHFQGAADLGSLAGGNYHYEGQITNGTHFFSTYRAAVDHGYFQMRKLD